jgi:hypothetical protein
MLVGNALQYVLRRRVMTESFEKICNLLGESIDSPKFSSAVDTFGEPTSLHDSTEYGIIQFNAHGLALYLNRFGDFYSGVSFFLERGSGPDHERLPYALDLPFGLFVDDSIIRIAKKICFSSDDSNSPWQPIGGQTDSWVNAKHSPILRCSVDYDYKNKRLVALLIQCDSAKH